MATLTDARIVTLLEPYLEGSASLVARRDELASKFSTYLDLLLRWNARTNLTSVRDPEEMVTRHFGESVFTAAALLDRTTAEATLLDFGSGAGFPGLPIQLCCPTLQVCLAESQNKKAAFLREAIRTFGLSTDVWMGRVEGMPAERTFQVVTLRAVDKMEDAVVEAGKRVAAMGQMAILAGTDMRLPAGWKLSENLPIPETDRRSLFVLART